MVVAESQVPVWLMRSIRAPRRPVFALEIRFIRIFVVTSVYHPGVIPATRETSWASSMRICQFPSEAFMRITCVYTFEFTSIFTN